MIFFLVLFAHGIAQERKSTEEAAKEIVFTSLSKSLLIPGWGQLSEKRYIEGVIFFSAEVFSIYKIFSYNHKGNTYYSRYKQADNVADAVKFRELTEKYDKRRNIFMLVAASIWAINLIDIYVIVRNKEKRRLKLEINTNGKKGLAFTLNYSF